MGEREREREVDWRLVLRLLFLQYRYCPVTEKKRKIILKINRRNHLSFVNEASPRRGEKTTRVYFVHI